MFPKVYLKRRYSGNCKDNMIYLLRMQRAPVGQLSEFNLEDPDQVLLRFLQRAQADDLGLVLVESKDLFPLSQQAHIPCMEVCFVREGVQEILGNKDVQVAEEDLRPKNVYMYWGF